MPTYIDTTNLSPATIAQLQGPVITQIQITNSSYTVIDDTAVSTSGGFIRITGSNFTAGTQVVIGTAAATSVTFVNSTTLNVQVPAQSAGSYVVYVTINTGSVAIMVNGVTYSGVPTWVTGSTLPQGQVDQAISIQLSATGDAPLTYALAAGSSLPPGLTLTSGGLLSGTVTGITSQTVYNFTINAIDAEAQDSPRGFSITITATDQNFNLVTTLFSANTPASTFVADASTNNFAVTVNGDTRPNNFGPYTPGYYSNFFDGTGDYLTVADNVALQMSGNFTWEAWVYPLSLPSSGNFKTFWAQRASSAGFGGPAVVLDSAGNLLLFIANAAASSWAVSGFDTGLDASLNQWQHIALVKNSTTLTLYKNGIAGTSTTHSTAVGTSGSLSIMAGAVDGVQTVDGYMSNFRIVKGTAVYTSNFTPSTTPLTAIADTSLLTCQSNRFIDNSTNNFTITRLGDTLISGFDPFVPSSSFAGRGSGYFDGTGDYLSATGTALNLVSGDFTIEAWIYIVSGSTYQFLIGSSDNASGFMMIGLNVPLSPTSTIAIGRSGINWPVQFGSSITFVSNTWHHIAITRSGTTNRAFINGVQLGSNIPDSTSWSFPSNTMWIGSQSGGTAYNGYMTDVRIVKGTAVYTSTFTPPTTPLTAIANTSLLTLQNNQPNNNNMFLDNSSSNLNITRVGNATLGSVNPYMGGSVSVYFPNSGVMNSQTTSGAHLTVSNTTAFDLGTGDFTLEGWIYPQSLPSSDNWPGNWWQTSSLFGRGTQNLGDGYNLILGATRLLFQNADTNVVNGLHGITVNNWYHVAACRSSGTIRLFVNGSQVATASFTGSVGGGSFFYVGTETGQGAYFNGYMSNIRLVRGTALYTTTFTPSTSPLLPITGTQLLIANEGNWIDDSNNQYTVSSVNSASIQKFNPFAPRLMMTPTSYSYNFTGGNLQVPDNSALVLSGGTFTIECWVYTNGDYGTYRTIITKRTGASAAWQFYLRISNGVLSFYTSAGEINSSSTPIAYQWNHVAAVYDGTNINLYMNGSRVHQATVANNDVATAVTIGAVPGANETYSGYISNLRITKGAQLYTGTTYTVPSAPLTTTVSSGTVSLLTCQSTTIVDNSVNNFAITVGNPVTPSKSNPAGYTYPASTAYTPATYGASTYLDGNGDCLTSPDDNAFEISNVPFTIECWIWPISMKGYQGVLAKAGSADQNGWILFFETNNSFNFAAGNGTWIIGLNGGSVTTGCWTHAAVTRDSSNVWRLFTNGVLRASTTNSATINQTAGALQIGRWPFFPSYATTMDFGGYISDVRIIKGQALYTSNFVMPSAPLAAIANTTFLANMTSAGIYDSSMTTDYETVGNTSISTSVKKYGNSSIYFDGSGDYLITPASPNFVFGTGDFTIECWLYLTALGADDGVIIELRSTGVTGNGFVFNTRSSGGGYVLNFYTDSAPNLGSTVMSLNTWNHVAVTRSGSTVRLFSNGALSATITKGNNFSNSVNPTIGQSLLYSNSNLTGYMDDFRITNGFARYTAAFTPPTNPFQAL